MSKKFPRIVIWLVVIGMAASVAACGGDDNGGGSSADIKLKPDDQAYIDYQKLSTEEKLHKGLPCTGSDDSAVAPDPEQAAAYKAPKADEEYTIGFMEPTLAGHYYQAGSSGAYKAAADAGVKLEFVSAGTGYASPEQQLRQADQLVQKGVDAAVIIPTDIQGGVAVANRFLDEDIPVVIVATEAGSPDAYMVMQDDYQMGRDSADLVVDALGEDAGPGIVIAGPANATWSAKRAAGFADQVKEKYPGVKIVASPTQNVDPALGLKSFENAVQGNPDIKWVYTVFNLLLDPDSLPPQYKDTEVRDQRLRSRDHRGPRRRSGREGNRHYPDADGLPGRRRGRLDPQRRPGCARAGLHPAHRLRGGATCRQTIRRRPSS